MVLHEVINCVVEGSDLIIAVVIHEIGNGNGLSISGMIDGGEGCFSWRSGWGRRNSRQLDKMGSQTHQVFQPFAERYIAHF